MHNNINVKSIIYYLQQVLGRNDEVKRHILAFFIFIIGVSEINYSLEQCQLYSWKGGDIEFFFFFFIGERNLTEIEMSYITWEKVLIQKDIHILSPQYNHYWFITFQQFTPTSFLYIFQLTQMYSIIQISFIFYVNIITKHEIFFYDLLKQNSHTHTYIKKHHGNQKITRIDYCQEARWELIFKCKYS